MLTLAAVLILAQNPPPTGVQDAAPWAQLVGSGFVAGLLWYLITVQFPRITGQFAEEMKACRSEHAKERADLRESYLAQARAERELFAEQGRLEREECERRHQELLAHALKTHDVVREVRHEVANLAQSRAMEKALREAEDQRKKHQSPQGGRP